MWNQALPSPASLTLAFCEIRSNSVISPGPCGVKTPTPGFGA
jgi:hypothetical protein